MISNGIPNGYCRVISPDGDLDFFGCFVNGSLVGNCWKGLMGGNFYNRVVPELEILTVLKCYGQVYSYLVIQKMSNFKILRVKTFGTLLYPKESGDLQKNCMSKTY